MSYLAPQGVYFIGIGGGTVEGHHGRLTLSSTILIASIDEEEEVDEPLDEEAS
jgi:hypothetical protein